MAWVDLADSLFNSGKPGKGSIFKQMRDNLAAMAAGASGAPGIGGAIANSTAGAVGAYVLARQHATDISTGYTMGSTLAGSSLQPSAILYRGAIATTGSIIAPDLYQPGTDDHPFLSGTWKLMGAYANGGFSYNDYPVSLWLRIA